jgi:hypothetical protein
MALTTKQINALQANVEGISIGKLVCIATAVFKFLACWKSTGGSDTCVKTLIKDLENCLKKK